MILGAALVIVGALVLYYAVTGKDPRDVARGIDRPSVWGSGLGAGAAAGATGGTAGATTGTGGSAPSQGTPQVRMIIAALRAIPGWRVGRICGPGSVPGSDHPCCGAVDIVGPRPVLMAVARAAVGAMMSRVLPISYVIGPDTGCALGRIWTRDGRSSCYSGPNSHQDHVHISAYPECHRK